MRRYIENYSYFLAGSSDSEDEYNKILGGVKTNEYCIALCINVANPNASPKGTSIVSFTTLGSPIDWDDLSEEKYVALKEEVTDKMLKLLKEKAGIDLMGHVEEVSIASPWTFARYLNVPEGAVYGNEVRGWDNMMPRMMTLALDFPVKGLRPIGASGPRGDGYSGCMITGNIVGKLALKDLEAWAEGGAN